MKDMKFDGGKLRASLPFLDFPNAMEELVRVADMGSKKYEASSWKTVPNAEERYRDALTRHFLASFKGVQDEESGLDHLAHMAWGCMALMELRIAREKEVHDENISCCESDAHTGSVDSGV